MLSKVITMDPIKSFVLTLLAVLAGLYYLEVGGPGQTASPPEASTMAEHNAASATIVQAAADSRAANLEEVSDSLRAKKWAQVKTTDAANPQQAADWALQLYPELARIMEMEELSGSEALAGLLPMMSDKDPVVRLAALESLADMNHPARTSMLAVALDDPVAQIRVAALQALAMPGDVPAWPYIEPYLYDRDSEVRVAAIEALAVLEQEQVLPSIAGLLSDHDRNVRQHAVNALADIGGYNAKSYLIQARSDPDQGIRVNAEAILQELESDAAYQD